MNKIKEKHQKDIKITKNTKNITPDTIDKLLASVKSNCTAKFDESIDLNFLINNKQKK